METIKDLWASLVAYANERSTNPLTSAFLLTWAAWNYKFFVVLFNDETSAEKFAAIEKLYPRPDTYLSNGLLYPALTTLFYVFAYPYITKRVVTFYRKRQVEIANEIKDIEGTRVRTVEEVTRLVRDYEQRLTASDVDQKAARAEAGELRNALTAAESELKELRLSASSLAEANRHLLHEGINDRNIRYINVRKSADKFIDAFSLRTTMASSDLLKEIGPFSKAELKILFYLGDAGERRSTPIETGNFMEMNATDVMPLLHRLADRDLIDLKNDAASISYKGRSVLDRMKEVVSAAA